MFSFLQMCFPCECHESKKITEINIESLSNNTPIINPNENKATKNKSSTINNDSRLITTNQTIHHELKDVSAIALVKIEPDKKGNDNNISKQTREIQAEINKHLLSLGNNDESYEIHKRNTSKEFSHSPKPVEIASNILNIPIERSLKPKNSGPSLHQNIRKELMKDLF